MFYQTIVSHFSFPVLLCTEPKLKENYIEILNQVLELNTITKKENLLSSLFDVYNSLKKFKTTNKGTLTAKEKKYISALINFVLQLRRYIRTVNYTEFPQAFLNLDEIKLSTEIEKLAKDKKIGKDIYLYSRPFKFAFKIAQPTRKFDTKKIK